MNLQAARRKARAKAKPGGIITAISALGYAMAAGAGYLTPMSGLRPRFDIDTGSGTVATEDDVSMGIGKVRDKLTALSDEIDALEALMNGEEADEAAKAKARNEHGAKSKEFAKYEKQLEQLQGKAARQNTVRSAKALATVRAPGANPNSLHAEPKDHGKEEKAREGLFQDYFSGKSISESGRDALAPRASGWKGDARQGVVLPKRFADALVPDRHGKALPLTSDQSSPANLYQSEFRRELLQYDGEGAFLFPHCRKVPTSSGTVLYPQLVQAAPGAEGAADEFAESGGVACAWTAEGAEKPGTEPSFRQVSLPTFELSAKTELSRTLIRRDTIGIEALLQTLFRRSIYNKIDRAILSGNGIGKPTGVIGFAGIATPDRVTTGLVKYDDLVNCESALAPDLRQGAKWAIADGALQSLKKVKDTAGRPLFLPNTIGAGMAGKDVWGTLMGYPVMPTQKLTLGNEGDLVLGNWDHYVCPVEQEVVIMVSEHEKASKGVVVYVVFMQVGGKPVETRAFAVLDDAQAA